MSDPYTDEQIAMASKWQKNLLVAGGIPKRRKNRRKKTSLKRCKYCKTTEDLTIDHILPKSLGGTNVLENLQCLCKRCNSNKSSFTEGQLKHLFKWFLEIQKSREEHGKKPYTLR